MGIHEESARKAYHRVESHNHSKLQLLSKGFLITDKKTFIGASLDNIRCCQCSTGCPDVVVKYKCPWKHQDKHPKDAFITPEVGGVKKGNVLALSPSSKYYFQVQLPMYVANLTECDLVIWTRQGIYTNVCHKLEIFWKINELPVMLASVF